MPEEKEVLAVSGLDANKRYQYTVKRIVDFETLWVLGDEHGIRTYDDGFGNLIFPIWPFKEFALLCCEADFEDCQPQQLQLDEFIKDYIPNFQANDYKLSLLPLPSNKGSIVELNVFESDIKEEMNKY